MADQQLFRCGRDFCNTGARGPTVPHGFVGLSWGQQGSAACRSGDPTNPTFDPPQRTALHGVHSRVSLTRTSISRSAHVNIRGESYRLKDRRRAGLLPRPDDQQTITEQAAAAIAAADHRAKRRTA